MHASEGAEGVIKSWRAQKSAERRNATGFREVSGFRGRAPPRGGRRVGIADARPPTLVHRDDMV